MGRVGLISNLTTRRGVVLQQGQRVLFPYHVHTDSEIHTTSLSNGGKEAGTWGWQFTCMYCRCYECVELHLQPSIYFVAWCLFKHKENHQCGFAIGCNSTLLITQRKFNGVSISPPLFPTSFNSVGTLLWNRNFLPFPSSHYHSWSSVYHTRT